MRKISDIGDLEKINSQKEYYERLRELKSGSYFLSHNKFSPTIKTRKGVLDSYDSERAYKNFLFFIAVFSRNYFVSDEFYERAELFMEAFRLFAESKSKMEQARNHIGKAAGDARYLIMCKYDVKTGLEFKENEPLAEFILKDGRFNEEELEFLKTPKLLYDKWIDCKREVEAKEEDLNIFRSGFNDLVLKEDLISKSQYDFYVAAYGYHL